MFQKLHESFCYTMATFQAKNSKKYQLWLEGSVPDRTLGFYTGGGTLTLVVGLILKNCMSEAEL